MIELEVYEPGELVFSMHRDEIHAYRVDETGLTRVDLISAIDVAKQDEPGQDAILGIPVWEPSVYARPVNLGEQQYQQHNG